MIDQENLSKLIEQQVTTAIAAEIQRLLESPQYIEKIGAEISAIINRRISVAMSTINVADIIEQRTQQTLQINRQAAMDIFPGIQDASDTKQLTLLPGVVVVENDLAAKNLEVVDHARLTNLSVHGDLTLTGSINTDNDSWNDLANIIAQRALTTMRDTWQMEMKSSIVNDIQQNGIDITSATIEGEPLVINGQLNFAITESRLQQLGDLRELTVNGPLTAGCLYSTSRRLGVNTQEPEMAVSVWDEEVSIGIGKTQQNTAFVGTTRSQDLSIGANGRGDITISKDGITTIKKLYVGKNQIGHATEVPNWSGTKGDIIINTNYSPGDAFAWICLGAFRWQTLKAA